jgi:hypothetical protein
MKKLFLTTVCSALLMTGCASIVNGQNQSVSVSTTPAYGATCTLENNKGKWYIPSTPGSVTIHRSYNDLKINCEKKGYRRTLKTVASSTKGMAFGNVVFGGVIGAGVDMANGSAYDYPTDISVPLERA